MALLVLAAGYSGGAAAGSFEMFGLDTSYQLQATYAAAWRLHKPHEGIIDRRPASTIPLPDFMKVPESWNYDDGDRNFAEASMVNSRLTTLGELQISKGELGLLLRGDWFYDRVYRTFNDNDSPDSINKTEPPHYAFTGEARYFDGNRARLLDAYFYGSWYLGESAALNLRLGRHIAAWGESLFFSGIALAQSPADATKATVPGADVKSILLPVNQVSMQLSVNNELTFLAQYKLEFKETELNPVGEFYSIADVLGPGAEFIWGIENPFYLSNLSDADILSDDLNRSIAVIAALSPPEIGGPLTTFVNLLPSFPEFLPTLNLPLSQIDGPVPGTKKYINVPRGPDIEVPAHGQYGVGARYQLTSVTNVGLFRLRYHSTIGLPQQNYGDVELVPPFGVFPGIHSQSDLQLAAPVSYQVKYFDGTDMTAASLTTSLFGANIGMELIYREGIPILVDVDAGLLGPVPSPTRADISQIDLNALYLVGPRWFWDSIIFVANVGFIHVNDAEEACAPTACSNKLTYDRDAWAWATLTFIDRKNFVPGWDWQIPISLQGVGNNHTSLLGGFGSLMGEGDYRAGIAFNFTYLQALTLGVQYSGFIGRPDFRDRPYADRDNAGFTITYRF